MPQLSVIVPFHNSAPYAAQTLSSLRKAAEPGMEFILIDDGSRDATPEILAEGAERLPGSRIITHGRSRGVSAARNAGLDKARGDYIAFLDGDDFVAADHYRSLLATIGRLDCEMLRTDHVRVAGRKRTVHRITHGPRGVVMDPRDAILPVNRITSVDSPNVWAGIYRRSLADSGVLRFDEDLRTCEDRLWAWRLHLRAASFAVVGSLGLFYRRGVETSLTQIADDRQFDFIPAFDRIVGELLDDPDGERLMPKAVRQYCVIMTHHLNRLENFEPMLATRLQTLCAEALGRLEARGLEEILGILDDNQVGLINNLRAAA